MVITVCKIEYNGLLFFAARFPDDTLWPLESLTEAQVIGLVAEINRQHLWQGSWHPVPDLEPDGTGCIYLRMRLPNGTWIYCAASPEGLVPGIFDTPAHAISAAVHFLRAKVEKKTPAALISTENEAWTIAEAWAPLLDTDFARGVVCFSNESGHVIAMQDERLITRVWDSASEFQNWLEASQRPSLVI